MNALFYVDLKVLRAMHGVKNTNCHIALPTRFFCALTTVRTIHNINFYF